MSDDGKARSRNSDAHTGGNMGTYSGPTNFAEDEPFEYLDIRTIVETQHLHSNQCLVCGTKEDLTVFRVFQEHELVDTAV